MDRLIKYLIKLVEKILGFIYSNRNLLKKLSLPILFAIELINPRFPFTLVKDLLEILGL